MPKAILSNDRGLAQSSGNGLRLVPKNSLTAGLHFKTIEVDIGATGYTKDGDDEFVMYTGITLPAQSVILGVSAVVTELGNLADQGYSLDLIPETNKVAGNTITGEVEVLDSIEVGSGSTLNLSFGGFFDTPKSVTTNTSLVLLESGTNTGGTISSGKIVVTVAYAGVES